MAGIGDASVRVQYLCRIKFYSTLTHLQQTVLEMKVCSEILQQNTKHTSSYRNASSQPRESPTAGINVTTVIFYSVIILHVQNNRAVSYPVVSVYTLFLLFLAHTNA